MGLKGLNARQTLFVKYYIATRNGAEAARKAGYSKKTAREMAVGLLSNPIIRENVDKGLAKLSEKVDASAERTIREIAEIAHLKLNKQQLMKLSGNKLKALELLGKHFKLFTDSLELANKDNQPLVVLHMPANGSEAKNED